ncbi:MAG: glycosyltransferase family 2 protein [Ideonella sp.]
MPCLNEARTLADCIHKAQQCFARLGVAAEVVVADNGSTDGSIEIAQACGARVVHVPIRGYGAALSAGVLAAQGRYVIMGDSDDSYDWSQVDGFIQALEGGSDLVMGNRFKGGIEPGAMPPLHRYLGNPVLSTISRIAFRIPIGDFHCGMRGFSVEAFRRMGLTSTGMEFATEMVAAAAQLGLWVSEIPIKLYPDRRGRPPHLRSFHDGWRHLRFILSHSPDHLFVWPGLSMLLVGMLLMCALAVGPVQVGRIYLGIHFMVLGAMLAMLGTNIVSMGILAKMILGMGPPDRSKWLRRLLERPRILEWLLVMGGMLALLGLALDAGILWRWATSHGQPMDDTIHLSIFASTVVVLGCSVAFFAFLVFLARARLKPS